MAAWCRISHCSFPGLPLFSMVFHRFCPQALAEALRVNKTVTNIYLPRIGNEGAKARCLERAGVGPGDLSKGL